MTLYLTQEEVKQILDMKSAFEAVENSFREMGNKAIEMPPRVYLHFPKGVLIAMPAYMPNLNAAGTKLVSVHPGNRKEYNLPAVQAKIIINSPENGIPLAIMDGTYITAVRTGAAGAVGIKYLSCEDAQAVGLCGLGVQGRSQIMGLILVRPNIKKIKIFDIIPEAIPPFIKEMKTAYPNVDFVPAKSAEEATKGSDIVITCTPSSTPFIKGEWLKKGAHISAIGADTAAKRELETSVIKTATKLVVDYMPQAFVVGDFAKPKEEGVVSEKNIYAEMGEIVAGHKEGRINPEEITLYKATGLAIQDVSTAVKVYEIALKKKIGRDLPS
jgi:alanine dehydrogenase